MLLVIQFKLMNIVQYSYLLMTCNKSGCLWRIFLAVLTKAWIWFYVFFDLTFSYGTCNMSVAIHILSTESCLKRGVLMGWKQIRENCILQLLRERVVGGSVGKIMWIILVSILHWVAGLEVWHQLRIGFIWQHIFWVMAGHIMELSCIKFCNSQENTAQALGICLRLLESNRSSDSVRK